jgi:hypothetical protein
VRLIFGGEGLLEGVDLLLEFGDFFMKHFAEFLLLLEINVIALIRVNNLLQLVILVLALFF